MLRRAASMAAPVAFICLAVLPCAALAPPRVACSYCEALVTWAGSSPQLDTQRPRGIWGEMHLPRRAKLSDGSMRLDARVNLSRFPLFRLGGKRNGDDMDGPSERLQGRAPWEQVQWSNTPQKKPGKDGKGKGERKGSRDGEKRKEMEDEELEMGWGWLNNEPQRRPPGLGSRSYRDNYLEEGDGPRRRQWGAEDSPSWDVEWFRQGREDEGGVFGFMQNLYNALFFYGTAYDKDEYMPAMNFKDLMEQYETTTQDTDIGDARAYSQLYDPEVGGDDYLWRNKANDRREGRGGTQKRRRKAETRGWEEQEDGWGWEEDKWDARAGAQGRARAGQRAGRGELIGRLYYEREDLGRRVYFIKRDIQKVDDRLTVLDPTVELWLRRCSAMTARGVQESDTEMLQAKRRIYKLKEEGRQLDNAKFELQERLDICNDDLDRVHEKLVDLGAVDKPYNYKPPSQSPGIDSDDNEKWVEEDKNVQSAPTAWSVQTKTNGDRESEAEMEKEAITIETEDSPGVDEQAVG